MFLMILSIIRMDGTRAADIILLAQRLTFVPVWVEMNHIIQVKLPERYLKMHVFKIACSKVAHSSMGAKAHLYTTSCSYEAS